MNCEICGSAEADYMEDPYQMGMFGISEWMWLCWECYKDRVGSV